MRILKPFLFVLCLWSVGSTLATELFLLNKTGQPLYYKLYYFTFGQTILLYTIPTTTGEGMRDEWFRKRLRDKVKEGWIVNDGIAHIKSYRLFNVLCLQKDKAGKSLITSVAGDKRIFDMCQTRKMRDCLGSTLRGLKPSIRWGALDIDQPPAKHVYRSVVLVVTLDPAREKQGKTGYILTELAHTSGLVRRRPKSFFYELQGVKTP